MSKGEKFRVDRDGVLQKCLNDHGQELPDGEPMAAPIGFVRQAPLHERIRAMVQHEYRRAAESKEVETPDEADDFVIDDDGEDVREARFAVMPGYEWEENYEPPADFRELRDRLVSAGWTPPSKPGQEASSARARESDGEKKTLDAASTKSDNVTPGPGPGGSV